MWSVYGIDNPNVEGVTNPKSFIIGDFKPSESITEIDFNNASKSFLCLHPNFIESAPSVYRANSNKFSGYVQDGSFPSNLLSYTRFNILHRKSENSVIVYEYDRCAFEWTYHEAGTNLYYFDAYRLGTLTYSHCPSVTYDRYSNNAITRNYVRTMQLIATKGNGTAGIGCVRPLWGLDFTGLTQFQDNPIQYVLGPIMPSSTIEEWLKYTKEYNPDAPDKPIDPENADQASVESSWDFKNKFRIMNWSGPWPNKFLIDGVPSDHTDFLNNYCIYNSHNDPDKDFYVPPGYVGDSTALSYLYDSMRGNQEKINDEIAEVGHDVKSYAYVNGTDIYFTTRNNNIDHLSGSIAYFTHNTLYKVLGNGSNIVIDPVGSWLNTLKIGSFSIDTNYPNNTQTFYCGALNSGGGTPSCFLDCCIIRYGGHYYLGGWYYYKYFTDGSGGFTILCRIDDLEEMPNHGGSDPGDPAGTGEDKGNFNNIFGDGSETEPNPSTDNEIEQNLGDVDNGGSGELADPVNTEEETNLHDGSVDNGTGDPHEGDDEIGDPADDLPSGTDTEGTVSGTGVISVFTPTVAELTSFTGELLSPTVLNSIKNFFTTNPMDGIFSLHMLPFTGFSGTAVANPRIGTHNFTSTLTLAASEYITIDYGTIYVPFVYDGYENYAPNSDVKIFLPFIGTKDVDINIIQGCNCNLKYNVSLVTGDIYAYMYCQWAGASGQPGTSIGVNHLMYSWQGNCAATIPLSHLDSSNYISGSMRAAGGISSLVAGAVTGNPLAVAGGIMAAGQAAINSTAEKGRTQIITSGNISGVSAFMGCREPYFIFSRPIIAFNSSYNRYLGLYSNAVMRISEIRTGTFTQMHNVDLSGIPATNDELNEIESIMKGGFYI